MQDYLVLQTKIIEMDKWFKSFLNGKGKKLDKESLDSPSWIEYRSQVESYSKAKMKLRLLEHKVKK